MPTPQLRHSVASTSSSSSFPLDPHTPKDDPHRSFTSALELSFADFSLYDIRGSKSTYQPSEGYVDGAPLHRCREDDVPLSPYRRALLRAQAVLHRPVAIPAESLARLWDREDASETAVFLRAYSEELRDTGIHADAFISFIDLLNEAMLSHPSIRAQKVHDCLDIVNYEIFTPRGLEASLCSTQHLDAVCNDNSFGFVQDHSLTDADIPHSLRAYQGKIAHLDTILPSIVNNGRPRSQQSLTRRDSGRISQFFRRYRSGSDIRLQKPDPPSIWLIINNRVIR